jgi:pyrophosphatase PpaX
MKYKALIFDLDGTLVNSTDSVVAQLGAICREFGGIEVDADEIIDAVHRSGGAIGPILKELMGEQTAEQLAAIRTRHEVLLKTYRHLLKPYLGAVETLDTLHKRGYKMAIFTSRSRWIIDDDPACELLLPYFVHSRSRHPTRDSLLF